MGRVKYCEFIKWFMFHNICRNCLYFIEYKILNGAEISKKNFRAICSALSKIRSEIYTYKILYYPLLQDVKYITPNLSHKSGRY